MTPMTVRGLPRGLQRDAWWMAADAQTGVGRGSDKPKPWSVWLLVVCADILVMRSAWFGICIPDRHSCRCNPLGHAR